MRTRLVLAGAAMGAALLTGGTIATVQAAPASSATTTAVVPGATKWIYVGTYATHEACYRDGQNSAYADWDCKQSSSGKWQLWVDDAS
ncbi:hypothetical protein ABZ370_15705 [Streptomyces sp. NPDC005962]|uniref:hypothetical protein n=1 Tax=Streptomyces sp. NPDC005962 TaxID=3154466 RepID=UPI0033F58710